MVSGKRKNDLVAEIISGRHYLLSGVSQKLGGHDEGPGPHEILEASLAACTIITAQMYANRKGMKLDSTDVEVKIISEGKETQIERRVSFKGELSQDERDRLLQIVGKCPIHQLLQGKIQIETKVQD